MGKQLCALQDALSKPLKACRQLCRHTLKVCLLAAQLSPQVPLLRRLRGKGELTSGLCLGTIKGRGMPRCSLQAT